jgi:hypothetical protein
MALLAAIRGFCGERVGPFLLASWRKDRKDRKDGRGWQGSSEHPEMDDSRFDSATQPGS